MMTSAPPTSPSISPSTCKVPWLMILRPWPMILRSLPITDLGPSALPWRRWGRLGAELAWIGSSVLGSAAELRGDIRPPQGLTRFFVAAMATLRGGKIVSAAAKCTPVRLRLAWALGLRLGESPLRPARHKAANLPRVVDAAQVLGLSWGLAKCD